MPQPFNNIPFDQFLNLSKDQFRQEAKKLDISDRIGDLAHFLVKNFRSEVSSEEHIVDTAIRILSNNSRP